MLGFFRYVLERINWKRDLHFHTNTTMDTLDYSGDGLNSGSKVVLAAYGKPLRTLADQLPAAFKNIQQFSKAVLVMPGVVAIEAGAFAGYEAAAAQVQVLNAQLLPMLQELQSIAMIVLTEDAGFLENNLQNFLWVTFTRSNPSHDIHGIDAFTTHKHWGCNGPLVIDARIKPHHAPILLKDENVEKRIDKLFEKGGSLHGIG